MAQLGHHWCRRWQHPCETPAPRIGRGRGPAAANQRDHDQRPLGLLARGSQRRETAQCHSALLRRGFAGRAAIPRMALGRAQATDRSTAGTAHSSPDFQPGAHTL